MKQILAAGLGLVTAFALAVSCHHDSGLQTVPPSDPTSTPGSAGTGVSANGMPPSGTQTWSSGSNGGGWGSGSGSSMGSGSGY